MEQAGLILAGALIITTSSIGLYSQKECTQTNSHPNTVSGLKTTLYVGLGLGILILLFGFLSMYRTQTAIVAA